MTDSNDEIRQLRDELRQIARSRGDAIQELVRQVGDQTQAFREHTKSDDRAAQASHREMEGMRAELRTIANALNAHTNASASILAEIKQHDRRIDVIEKDIDRMQWAGINLALKVVGAVAGVGGVGALIGKLSGWF